MANPSTMRLALCAGILAVSASCAGAPPATRTTTPAASPTPAPPQPAPAAALARTTESGVYTTAQANRGRQVYAGQCQSCHTPEDHSSASFRQEWDGRPLFDLYRYIGTQMPDDNPGTLSEATTADLVAYLLKLNASPAGTTELPPDSAALAKIQIVIPTKGSHP